MVLLIMKTKSIIIVSFLIFSLLTLTSVKNMQVKQLFEGVYDGRVEYGYNFEGVDDEGDKYTMTFHKIGDELLKSFNLNSEELIGTKFSVTYTTEIKNKIDENDFKVEIETVIITDLKKL